MSRLIEKLHKKPKGVRIQYALLGSFLITSLITTIWWFGKPTTASFGQAVDDSEVTESVSLLFGQARAQFAQVISGVASVLPGNSTSTDEVAPAATTTVATPPPAIIMPDLSARSTSTPVKPTPTARPILIATTSAETASSSQ